MTPRGPESAHELLDLGDRRVLTVEGWRYETRYSERAVRMLIERKRARRAPPYFLYKETRGSSPAAIGRARLTASPLALTRAATRCYVFDRVCRIGSLLTPAMTRPERRQRLRVHGTAQFGSHYGVSDRNGQPSLTEVGEILEIARRSRVEVIDTKASYGGGEAAIGRALPAGHKFRIVTKLAPLAEHECAPAQARKVRERFGRLLADLGQETIYGLLAHRIEDLLVPGGARLVDAMREIAARGQLCKIGVNRAAELEEIVAAFAALRSDGAGCLEFAEFAVRTKRW